MNTQMKPGISVIVPVYGVEKYLNECVDSILNQTFRDIEVLLIDDGGKDHCPQMCDDYARRDSRVRVIHKENGGYGHTCNVGLSEAQGEYISIIEPDDFIEATMYEELYEVARTYDSDVVKSAYNDYWDFKPENKVQRCQWHLGHMQGKAFTIQECPQFLWHHPSIWTCLYKRDFIEEHHIRFVEAPGSGWTDAPFQVQTLCLARRINYVDKAFYNWRSIQADYANKLNDWTIPFKRCDEIHAWLDEHNITDAGILACLALREIRYTGTAIRSVSFSQLKELRASVDKMLDRINIEALKNSPYARPASLYNYSLYRKKLYKVYFRPQLMLLKKIQRFICCIRLSRNDFCIQVLGIQIRRGQPIKPSLFVIKL